VALQRASVTLWPKPVMRQADQRNKATALRTPLWILGHVSNLADVRSRAPRLSQSRATEGLGHMCASPSPERLTFSVLADIPLELDGLVCGWAFPDFLDEWLSSMISRIWSVNEWGPLQEIILGSPAGSLLPSMADVSQRNFDRLSPEEATKTLCGPMPEQVIEETREDLDGLEATLHQFGVVVHRAEGLPGGDLVHSPHWIAEVESAINIRDITLIHGDLVIDAPTPTRGRQFETFAVRDLLSQTAQGPQWLVAPPRPRLLDASYDLDRPRGLNEVEPLFDAANCVRLGRNVIIDINNTANLLGAQWLQHILDRHHGTGMVRVHPVMLSPDHIDVIIVPLCEGTALYNPKYVDPNRLPEFLQRWKLIPSPPMVSQPYFSGTPKASNWIGLNVLVVNGEERTVIVEERQTHLRRELEHLGFHPIPVRWRHGRSWGGAFHCVTLDVNRLGTL
jgi:N-dimethylarginine dimethylaminohydrolase